MVSFTDAAYIILKKEGKPLTGKQIVDKAIKQKILETKGKTPELTMCTSIYLENKRKLEHEEPIRFQRGDSFNIWGLTEWK